MSLNKLIFAVLFIVGMPFSGLSKAYAGSAGSEPSLYSNYHHESRKISEIVGGYLSAGEPQEKEVHRLALLEVIDSMEQKTAQALQDRDIKFDIVPAFADYTKFYGFEWHYFRISIEGHHWLNRMAMTVKNRFDVDLAYDPIAFMGFGGAFWSPYKVLTLSYESVLLPQATHTEGHEMIHVLFWAQRLGKVKYSSAPVNISFRSREDIDPATSTQVYQQFMSFEEMVTFGYNILFAAKNYEINDGAQEHALLQHEIEKLIQISRNAELATQKAKLLSNERNHGLMEIPGEGHHFIFGRMEDSFNLNVFIPEKELSSAESYAVYEIHRALELSEFNQKYFEGFERWSPSQLIQRSKSFRAYQRDFIQGL